MNRVNYLLDLHKQKKFDHIKGAWQSLGSLQVDSNTKAYLTDSIFYITPQDPLSPQGLEGHLLYALSTYRVGKSYSSIEWASLGTDIEKWVITENGIVYPFFKILLTREEFDSASILADFNFPDDENTSIIIDDSELELIMNELGVGFFSISELEYNSKEQLCNLFIKPTLQEYHKWFPIVEQKDFGMVSAGHEFEFELPPMCFNAMAQVRKNGGGGSSGGFTSAMSFMREQYISGGGMGLGGAKPWMSPLRYNKPVPGYTGAGTSLGLTMMNRAISSAMENYSKRVKIQIVNKDRISGKKLVKGYSVTSGSLEMYLCFYSNDWSDIMFEQINNCRKLAKAYALQSFGLLRSFIKSDLAGALDSSLLNNKGEKYEQDVLDEWKKSPHSWGFAIRG